MFESVRSGRRTKFFKLKAATSAPVASRTTKVQRVRGGSSLRQHKTTSSTKEGSQIKRARRNTRCSKFSLNPCDRSTLAGDVPGSEAILLDPPVETPATEAERFRSMADVASMACKSLTD